MLLVFPIWQFANANQTNIQFDRYSIEHGLSQEAIFSITQDRQGYMWFATQEGVNRFDGYRFENFYHDPDNENSLSNDVVYSIIEDHQGMLWLGTYEGLDRFDPQTATFTHFNKSSHQLDSDRVYVVFEDSDNMIWVGTEGGGLSRFDRQSQNFQTFRYDPKDRKSLNDDNVRSIHQDKDGRLWIGTDKGLNLFEPASGSFLNFNDNNLIPEGIKKSSIRSLFTDAKRRLWVGTFETGLFRLDADQTVVHFQHDGKNKHSLCHDQVSDIFQDNSGLIWVATNNGLCQWQSELNRFVNLHNDPKDPYSLSDNRTLSLFQDEGGVLWLGTFGGLNKWTVSGFEHYREVSNDPHSLSSNIITSFDESSDGEIWVGTYQGLNRLNRQTGKFTQYKNIEGESNSLSDNRIMSLQYSKGGALWIGTRGNGLDLFNPETGHFTNYRHDPNNSSSLSGNGITDIFEDNQGNLWVAVYGGGLNLINRQDNTFKHYRHQPDNPNSLSSDRILKVYQTRDGVLWIGTEGGGLNRLDVKSEEITHIRHQPGNVDSLSSDVAWSILEGPQGDLWIGTWGGGLNRWSKQDRQAGIVRFKKYGKKQGLTSSVVYDIVADEQGFLWLSTNKGLTRFDPDTEKLKQYDATQGLQSNEFNHNAAFKSSDGQIFFGGSNGFNAFYTKDITTNTYQPSVVITNVLKVNKKLALGSWMQTENEIEFDYKDYVVAFEYAGLDYVSPQKNRYRYKLEGLDEDWIDAGESRRATFTNLPAGDFIFKVKASNNEGVWSENGLSVNIKVTPPPWNTWWAYCLYALLIGAIIYFFLRNQDKKIQYERKINEQLNEKQRAINIRNVQLKDTETELRLLNKELEHRVKLRTTELEQSHEHLLNTQAQLVEFEKMAALGGVVVGVSHEINTPVGVSITAISTLKHNISALINKVSEGICSKRDFDNFKVDAESCIALAMSNLKKASSLVDDFKQIAVDRSDEEPKTVHLAALIKDSVDAGVFREKESDHNISVECPIDFTIYTYPGALSKVFSQLAHNSANHGYKSDETVNIEIKVEVSSTEVLIRFSDHGIGMGEETISQIFDPFYTTNRGDRVGLGLHVVYNQITHLLKGSIKCQSVPGAGSSFMLTLPLQLSQS